MSGEESSAIEFHDSNVSDLWSEGENVLIRFAPAYVHRSKGTPCVDPGTGWTQDAMMVLSGAQLAGVCPPFPCMLSDGLVSLGNQVYNNCLPAPFVGVGDVKLSFVFTDGSTIHIIARELRLDLVGDPVFVEMVP